MSEVDRGNNCFHFESDESENVYLLIIQTRKIIFVVCLCDNSESIQNGRNVEILQVFIAEKSLSVFH